MYFIALGGSLITFDSFPTYVVATNDEAVWNLRYVCKSHVIIQ